ncbi:MAG: FliI/YscN family ATPase [Acidobacteria bacterium]|nr:FliI/YscN family ATPase [Acidobacteriota bacterium]
MTTPIPSGWSAAPYLSALDRIDPLRWSGQVTDQVGLLIESQGPAASIGDFCEVMVPGTKAIRAQVVGFRDGRVLSMPLERTNGLPLGATIVARREASKVACGPGLLGRVLDGFGQPMDDGPPIQPDAFYDLHSAPPGPLQRGEINQQLVTGIRVIDGLLPTGKGQRIGLFGGSGVGKSTLMGTMVRNSACDVAVIALIGERNREVPDFLRELSEEGLKRSVVVCSTSDQEAPLKLRAAFVALAVSEYFRDQGKDVLLVMDSVTRLAMAQREIGLAAGEPPSQKGYTPSVFNLLPKICERAGAFEKGSITGFFTVLVDGDDFNEPICDNVRSILDGHIILDRSLGVAGHYPAIDVLNSVSRLAGKLHLPGEKQAARQLREAMAEYRHAADLINLGAYVSGSNPKLDSAIRLKNDLQQFLRQDSAERTELADTNQRMRHLSSQLDAAGGV